jgi:hypothetical protein
MRFKHKKAIDRMTIEPKVVSIHGDIHDPRVASDVVVAVLEKQLEKARAGEIVGVAVAFTYFDMASGYDSAGIIPHSLIGAVAKLQHELVSK